MEMKWNEVEQTGTNWNKVNQLEQQANECINIEVDVSC